MREKHLRKTGNRGGGVRCTKMMKCIFLGKQAREEEPIEESDSSLATRDYSASGYSGRASETQPKTNTNTSTIEEAESSLRESGFLNYEEARALLGRLEYQKGNIEGAFRVFEGIDVDSLIPNIKIALSLRRDPQRHNSLSGPLHMSMHSISLLFEAMFLKAKALHSLSRFEEAAQSCQVIVDTVESAIPEGLNGRFSTNLKFRDILNKTVEFLPSLWILAKEPQKAITSFRNALLYNWNLDIGIQARIEKEFAVFLLYSGTDTSPPTLRFQVEGAHIPCNNMEESILLLSLLLSKILEGRIEWDPSIMDHLSFALSVSENLETLANQIEQLIEGVIDRKEKYSTLALCYYGQGEDRVSLNLLRNLLKDRENHYSSLELLLASKICAEKDINCSEEGINYSTQAIKRLKEDHCVQLAGKASCLLGKLTSSQSRLARSDSERIESQAKALYLFENAEKLTKERDPYVIYHLALEYAEQRKLDTALSYAKKLLKVENGSNIIGWILLVRILSAKNRYPDAETIVSACLEQTGKWEHAELLRTRAKLEIAQGKIRTAIETYTHLLAVLQVRKKSYGFWKLHLESQDKTLEMETWNDLANIYTNLSQWDDAQVCLSKSKALCPHSASRCHSKGLLYQAKGLEKLAQKSFWKALDKDPNHVPSLLSMSKILMKLGDKSRALARSFVRQAIQIDRTNHSAWHTLGLLYRSESECVSVVEAIECFEAATMLEETAPIEPFR